MKKILFISGSVGLGHVGRDLEIAGVLRKIHPDIDISWMAESPASDVLERAGEQLLPETNLLHKANVVLEESAKEYKANLVQWAMKMRKGWAKNCEVYAKVFESYKFDLLIGDETYDILIAMVNDPSYKKLPFVVIYDILGLDASTWNPVDHIATYVTNRLWVKFLKSKPLLADKSIFVGELEDVPDKSFGFMLPNRRKLAKKVCNFVGYILPDDIENYRDKAEARKILGYGDDPLIICSIGGTAAGRSLLDLCTATFSLVNKKIPKLQMVLVCGPRVLPESVKAPEGVKVLGYVPRLYRHLGAADLCIVSAGGTITLELTALQKPFLYFPLEQHFEQEVGVASVCHRHRAGVKMIRSKTSPETMAIAILSNLGKSMDYAKIPINGAKEAARRITESL